MKRIVFFGMMFLMLLSCGKDKEPSQPDTEADPVVKIQVTGIDNNQATVTATLEEGKFYGGKILTNMKMSDVTFNYTRELALISYVEQAGQTIESLPYTITLENLRADIDYLSAVIIYGKDGIAISSDYETWTSIGVPEGWSNDNNAGNLEDNEL